MDPSLLDPKATTAFLPLLFWWAFFAAWGIVAVIDYGLEQLEQRTRLLRWRLLPLLRGFAGGKRPYVRVTVRWWVSVRTGVE